MNTHNKTCGHCQKEFIANNSRRKYCSDTCKTYASQVRTGKREAPVLTAASIGHIAPTEEMKKELSTTVESLNQQVIEINDRRDQLQAEYEQIAYKSAHEQKNRIDDLEEIINAPRAKDIYKREAAQEIEELQKEVAKIEEFNKQVKERNKQLEEELARLFLASFRATEKRNQFIKKHILNTNELSGSAISDYQEMQTRYPFSELDHCVFAYWGNPIQPFFVTITGEKDHGKSILAVLLSIELLRLFQSKILYVVDNHNRQKVLEYFTLNKVEGDNLILKFAETLNDIEKALSGNDFEFLFIDSNTSFRLNEYSLKKIKKAHPFLSIFLIARTATRNILDLATIECRTGSDSDPQYRVIKRAWYDLFVNGVEMEDGNCGIFLNNESQGFSIGF